MIRHLAALLLLANGADGDPPPAADPGATFLVTDDPVLRERSRRILIARGDASQAILLDALRGRHPRLREAAAYALERIGGADVDAGLVERLRDPDDGVRVAALRTLALRGFDRLHPDVAAAAEASHWALRRAAAHVLGGIDAPAAVRLLEPLAVDLDPDVADAAFDALIRSPAPAAAAVLRRLFDPGHLTRAKRSLERLRHPAAGAAANVDPAFFADVLAADLPPTLRVQAAAALAARGIPLVDGPHGEFLVTSSAATDPDVRQPAVYALARERERSAATLLRVLATTPAEWGESLAEYVVRFLGPAARTPLLEIARGDVPATTAARAAAVHALRRFKTPDTAADLVWVYTRDLPLPIRRELCAAFEDLPRTPAARSGLITALEDPDPDLRLRAFRLLLEVGASTGPEIDFLWLRMLHEPADWVRQRMGRLMAAHATGEGARRFALQMVRRLNAPDPEGADARSALENLGDADVRRRVGKDLAARLRPPVAPEVVRLLTRLAGPEADAVVAAELARRFAAGEADVVRRILIALRTGGGPLALDTAAGIVAAGTGPLRVDALRTLLARRHPAGLDALLRLQDDLSIDERLEMLSLLEGDAGELVLPLRTLLSRERDDEVKAALIQRAADHEVPVTDAVAALVDTDPPLGLLIQAAETLAVLGGPVAEERLTSLFQVALERLLARRPPADDDLLFLEATARAAARAGILSIARPLARLLLLQVQDHEPRQDEVDAAFPFEVTLLGALLDLATTSGRPYDVAAAVEVELDAAKQGGLLPLLPKAWFINLARTLEPGGEPFDPLRGALLDLGGRLPPRGGDYEVAALLDLAQLATEERDHVRAARHLERAHRLLGLGLPAISQELRDALGRPAPLAGFDPRRRLQADILLARARARRVMGDDRQAVALYEAAATEAPDDAWLLLRIGAELREDDLHRDGARRHLLRAVERAPFDADLLARAARVLAWAGFAADFDHLHGELSRLRQTGLTPDQVDLRLGMAEALVQLGRPESAREEIEAARRLDPATDARVAVNPLLAPLLVDPADRER